MAMHRSWIVWLTSTFAFCTTVAVILATGAEQNSNNRSLNAQAGPLEGRVQLPQINAYAQGYSASGTGASSSSGLESDTALRARVQPNAKREAQAQSQASSSQTTADAYSEPTASAQVQPVVGLGYQPQEVVRLAHPSNYGDRYARDIDGKSVDNEYIVVLHETVGSASSALNTFQTNHTRDEDQVSYHTLIALDGTIYYVVPPEQRAFGAGNSAFQSFSGEEAVFTNADFPSSVNNFAYHVSLETPLDGQNSSAEYHSGYTEAQYQSLAWLLARTNIPDDRITTHRTVDRSRSRIDPRSFEAERMFRLLRQYPGRQQAG